MDAGGDGIGKLSISPELSRPNAARVYDFWLGGAANFAVDREIGREIMAVEPRVVPLCRANRAFLIDPGVCWINDWWPDAQTTPGPDGRLGVYVGAARFS